MPVTKKDLERMLSDLERKVDVNNIETKNKFKVITKDVAALDADLDDIRDTAENARDDVSCCDDRCDDIESTVEDNESKLDEFNSRVDTLESDVSDIILIEGDD